MPHRSRQCTLILGSVQCQPAQGPHPCYVQVSTSLQTSLGDQHLCPQQVVRRGPAGQETSRRSQTLVCLGPEGKRSHRDTVVLAHGIFGGGTEWEGDTIHRGTGTGDEPRATSSGRPECDSPCPQNPPYTARQLSRGQRLLPKPGPKKGALWPRTLKGNSLPDLPCAQTPSPLAVLPAHTD